MTVAELVKKYIELRDQKAAMKAKFAEQEAKVNEVMEKIEAKLLQVMEQLGVDNMKSEAGTAYRSTRASTTVADRDAFLKFLQESGEWSLADLRAAKATVTQYKDANNGALPPGLNWREEVVVGIRRTT